MIFAFDGCELDDELYELHVRGKSTDIQPRAFDVLLHLIRHRDRVVLKEELRDRVWNGVHITDNALAQAIAGARAALDREDAIATVRGRGYRFALRVELHARPDAVAGALASEDRLANNLRASLEGARGGLLVDSAQTDNLDHALEGLGDLHVARVGVARESAPLEVWRQLVARSAALAAASGGEEPSADRATALDPRASALELADEILRGVGGASFRAPRLIVLDRIDRADLASVLLFAHVAREPRRNLCFVGTADLQALRRGGEASRILSALANADERPRLVRESGMTWRFDARRADEA